jgi:hypothetical protein
MNTFPRYFVFGSAYGPGDDYIVCEQPDRTVIVSPGVGQVSSGEDLSLSRCLSFVQKGVMSEATPDQVRRQPYQNSADRRRSADRV